MVLTCERDAVEPSRSCFGEVDPAMEAESGSWRGGVVEPERFGNPGRPQLVEERRITVPTRERKVFLGGGVVDITPSSPTSDTGYLQEKLRKCEKELQITH